MTAAAICAVLCVALAVATAALSLRAPARFDARAASSLPARRDARSWAIAVVLPALQLVFVLALLAVAGAKALAAPYLAAVVAADAFASAGTYALICGMLQTRSAQVNDERLRVAAERAQAAAEHEPLVARNIQETHRLCKYFAEELRALEERIESGDVSVSEDFSGVERALGELEEKTRASFCANKTVNAIVSLKAQCASGEGVAFSFSGSVPEEVDIDELELCSVFSNLLDNAVSAACDVAAAGECPAAGAYVRVSCAMRGAYLVVKVANSCRAEADGDDIPSSAARRRQRSGARTVSVAVAAEALREHGWGLEIVRDICTRHDGQLVLARPAPSEFSATAILKAVPEQK